MAPDPGQKLTAIIRKKKKNGLKINIYVHYISIILVILWRPISFELGFVVLKKKFFEIRNSGNMFKEMWKIIPQLNSPRKIRFCEIILMMVKMETEISGIMISSSIMTC